MSEEPVVINWHYQGEPEPLWGTGATGAEKALVWIAALLTLAWIGYFYLTGWVDWTWWQYLVAALLALDVGGGVVANSLNACKRFYHAPLQEGERGAVRLAKNHLLFSAFHVHTLLVSLLYGGGWGYGLFWYAMLLVGTLVVLKAPLYLRRPVAMLIVLPAVMINFYGVEAVTGFEWLVPALFLKIIYGHLVREEPYRPASE
jgi:hypothetical protein